MQHNTAHSQHIHSLLAFTCAPTAEIILHLFRIDSLKSVGAVLKASTNTLRRYIKDKNGKLSPGSNTAHNEPAVLLRTTHHSPHLPNRD